MIRWNTLKFIQKFILALCFLLLFSGCTSNEYEVFKPVYQKGNKLVVSDEPMSAEFKENIKFVLRHYGKHYKENQNGDILIPEGLWADRDLMWNYTTKANDPTWLNSR